MSTDENIIDLVQRSKKGDKQGHHRENKRRQRSGLRIFPFGVGYDVNTRLLDQLADEFSGVPEYIRPTETIDTRIEDFYSKIAEPLMTDLEIRIRGVDTGDIQPEQLPDIYRGGQLVLFGRYDRGGDVKIKLSGNMGANRRSFTFNATLPKKNRRNDFVGRLWAMRQVGALLREVRLHGDDDSLADEIRELGLKFGIATPYTSFLVEEDREESGYYASKSGGRNNTMHGSSGSHTRGVHEPAYRKKESATWGSLQSKYKSRQQAPPDPASAPLAAISKKIQSAVTGRAAVDLSSQIADLLEAETEAESKTENVVCIRAGRNFTNDGGQWIQAGYQSGEELIEIKISSDEYFALLSRNPDLGPVLALGENLIFELDNQWFHITAR